MSSAPGRHISGCATEINQPCNCGAWEEEMSQHVRGCTRERTDLCDCGGLVHATPSVQHAWRRVREFVEHHKLAGGCRMLSEGDGCLCVLCDIDRLAEAIRIAPPAAAVDDAKRLDILERVAAEFEETTISFAMNDEGVMRFVFTDPWSVVDFGEGETLREAIDNGARAAEAKIAAGSTAPAEPSPKNENHA